MNKRFQEHAWINIGIKWRETKINFIFENFAGTPEIIFSQEILLRNIHIYSYN